MTDNKDNKDILDVSSDKASDTYPTENMPNRPAERPRPGATTQVSPQEGGYFLNKFLNEGKKEEEKADTAAAVEAKPSATNDDLEEAVIEALKEIYDPEIPVNIYELGLVYGVDVATNNMVTVTMTLTTPHCPVAESMPGEVELKVNSVPGVNGAEVKLVWEPAWDMSKMSDEARLELGLL